MLHMSVMNISTELSEAIYSVFNEGLDPHTFVRVDLTRLKTKYWQKRLSASHTCSLSSHGPDSKHILVILVAKGHNVVSYRFNLSYKLVFGALELIRRRISINQKDAGDLRFIFSENSSMFHDLT